MKTILILTDFSANAAQAVEYGYQFAKQLNANTLLCNAFNVPAEIPQASLAGLPTYLYDEIMQSSASELNTLKQHLEKNNTGMEPDIKCISEVGFLHDVTEEICMQNKVDLIVMGTHGNNVLNNLLLGNHTRKMIERATKPLLLIPQGVKLVTPRKIAFASDLNDINGDLNYFFELVAIAKALNAELLLTYIYDENKYTGDAEKKLNTLITEVSNKADYPHIYYSLIKNRNVENGLDWLCQYRHVDILAMVHRKHDLFSKLLMTSHTQKMAGHISIPILVFPERA